MSQGPAGQVPGQTSAAVAEPPAPAQRTTPATGGEGAAVAASPPGRSGRHRLYTVMGHYGLLIALVIAVAGFSLARPSSFWSVDNLQNVLTQSSAPAILAIGLTFALVVGEFDLSIGYMLGLGGGAAVAMMSLHGLSWEVGVVVALAFALVAGAVNGILVAYVNLSSFIITLAMGTVLLGVNYLVAGNQTLFANISHIYLDFGQLRPIGGLNLQIFIALGVAIIAYVVLERTEVGRYMYAVGGNATAARLSGIAVRRYRLAGFVCAAVAASIAGILVTAQGAAATPDAGASYLLPAYAAAFLGTAGFSDGAFNVAGTVVGVVFLAVVTAGLTMFGISTGYIDIVQGGILVGAILVSDIGRRMLKTVGRAAVKAA